jgi:hypothetical protein
MIAKPARQRDRWLYAYNIDATNVTDDTTHMTVLRSELWPAPKPRRGRRITLCTTTERNLRGTVVDISERAIYVRLDPIVYLT